MNRDQQGLSSANVIDSFALNTDLSQLLEACINQATSPRSTHQERRKRALYSVCVASDTHQQLCSLSSVDAEELMDLLRSDQAFSLSVLDKEGLPAQAAISLFQSQCMTRLLMSWQLATDIEREMRTCLTWYEKYQHLNSRLQPVWPELYFNLKQRQKWFNRQNSDLKDVHSFKLDQSRNLMFEIRFPAHFRSVVPLLQAVINNIFEMHIAHVNEVLPKDKMDEFVELHSLKHQIVAIKGANQYSEVIKANGRTQLFNLALHTVETYLPADFVRVHRCHLVSRDRPVALSRKSNGRYILTVQRHQIPVGDRYLSSVKTKCPDWFV